MTKCVDRLRYDTAGANLTFRSIFVSCLDLVNFAVFATAS